MRFPAYEELEHTADWALKVRGKDLGELLRHAAMGMLHLSGAVPKAAARQERRIQLSAPDRESLLVDFLQELLLGLEMRQVTCVEIVIEAVTDTSLQAVLSEAPAEGPAKQIKAVTYHELHIEQDEHGLVATIVFDV